MKNFLPGLSNVSIFIRSVIKLLFENVYFFKPSLNGTSAEFYIIAKNFKGIEQNLIDLLLKNYNNINNININNTNTNVDEILILIENNKNVINKYLTFYYLDNDKKNKIYNVLKQLNKIESIKWIKKYML
jgi:hypothetical protein